MKSYDKNDNPSALDKRGRISKATKKVKVIFRRVSVEISFYGRKVGKLFLRMARDPIWQMIGAFIALVALLWSFYLYRNNPLTEASVDYSATNAVANPPKRETETVPSKISANVYVATWDGSQMTYSENLLLYQKSCINPEGFSNSLGGSPEYNIVLETRFELTFVNPNELPNGIIEIDPVYNSAFDETWELNAWEITMSRSSNYDNPVAPPIELPPNTPVKLYFRIRHVVDVDPGIWAISVYDYVDRELNPLKMNFQVLPPSDDVKFEVGFNSHADEAVGRENYGKFDFEKICQEHFSPWPMHIPGRVLGNGQWSEVE